MLSISKHSYKTSYIESEVDKMSINREEQMVKDFPAKRTPAKADMKPGVFRTLVAGITGGVGFVIVSFLTFVLIGSGPLSDPSVQNPKVIAVMTKIEPLPLWETAPQVILLGYVLFAIGHAFLFRSVAPAWPVGVISRSWRLALVIWGLSCLFFEFLGPFNLLGEPLGLVVLELGFWAVTALVEAAVVVRLLEPAGR